MTSSRTGWLSLPWLLLASACLDGLSVGLSESVLRADAGVEPVRDAASPDANVPDLNLPDAALPASSADASTLDASGADASRPDTGPADAGLTACAPSFCAIAGLTHETTGPCGDAGIASCLRDQTGICAWHCL